VTTCRTTRFGEPTDKVSTLLTVEGRRMVAGVIALNPNFVMDLDTKLKNVEVPIYFLRTLEDVKKEGKSTPSLSGGVSFGWHSKNGVYARAVIGVAFKLIRLGT
jgi:hypothetical protein